MKLVSMMFRGSLSPTSPRSCYLPTLFTTPIHYHSRLLTKQSNLWLVSFKQQIPNCIQHTRVLVCVMSYHTISQVVFQWVFIQCIFHTAYGNVFKWSIGTSFDKLGKFQNLTQGGWVGSSPPQRKIGKSLSCNT